MIAAGSLEFALARMQARMGRRPAEAAWRSIEQSRDVAPILEMCGETSLHDVAASLAESRDLHAADRAAREGWRRAVGDATAWMPADFAAALAWLRIAPLLPALEHLARGGGGTPWMSADADLAEVSAAAIAERASTVARGFMAALSPSWNAPGNLGEAWYAEWERRLPRAALHDSALAGLARDVGRHLARFRTAAVHEAPSLRRDLEARLIACFRRHALEPAAAFAWLGLVALDLERLRGELARRIAFPHARWVT
ncbi:MAG: hypothetical protein ABIQ72_12405 [Usitatibacter sp.]